jgi:hypothetical protein
LRIEKAEKIKNITRGYRPLKFNEILKDNHQLKLFGVLLVTLPKYELGCGAFVYTPPPLPPVGTVLFVIQPVLVK